MIMEGHVNNWKKKQGIYTTRNRTVSQLKIQRHLVKRRVSLNEVAARDWIQGTGNRNLKARPGNSDLQAFWTRIFEHSYSSSPNSQHMNNFHQNRQMIYGSTHLLKHNNNINII